MVCWRSWGALLPWVQASASLLRCTSGTRVCHRTRICAAPHWEHRASGAVLPPQAQGAAYWCLEPPVSMRVFPRAPEERGACICMGACMGCCL